MSAGLVLLVLQLVLAGSLILFDRQDAAALPAAPNPDDWDLPTPDMGLTVITGVERADEVARTWDDDARLAFVSLQVDWPTSPPPETVTSIPPFGWLRVVYVAPVEGGASDYAALSLLFERVSGALISSSVSAWSASLPDAGLLDSITVTDETAIFAAEVSGGTAFRAACPDQRSQSAVSMSLDAATGERHWNIVYRESGRNSGGPMRVTVNAATGEVHEARSGAATCAE
ncbi:MAG: hypothetical protein IT334_11725 [Thermomicrobiales bacterium]|nr:hypothetical protein [Thermomicrobiales bacterium]